MISVSPMDSYRIIQRDTTSGDAPGATTTYGKGWGTVSLSVTSDQATPLSYRIVDGTNPNRIIEDWTSTGQSSVVGTTNIQVSVDASTDCYVLQIAPTAASSGYAQSTPFFVGNVDAAAGQSKASAFFGSYAYPSDYSQAQPSLYSISAPFSARVFSDTNGNPFDSTPMSWQQPGDNNIPNGGAVSTFPAVYLSLREAELEVACGLVGIAKPGSSIEDWQPGISTYWYELQALLGREGDKINSFIWNQGDSDWSSSGVADYQAQFENLVHGLDQTVGPNYHLFSFDYMWIGGMQPGRFVTGVDLAKAAVSAAHGGSFVEGVSAGSDYFGGHPTMLARILGAEDLFRQVLNEDDPTADTGPALTGTGSLLGSSAQLAVTQDKGSLLVGQVTDFGSTTFTIRTALPSELASQFSVFEHGYTDAAHAIGVTSVDLSSPTQITLNLDQSPNDPIDVWYRADYGTPGSDNAAIRDDVTDYGITYGHQLQTRLTPVTIGLGATLGSPPSASQSPSMTIAPVVSPNPIQIPASPQVTVQNPPVQPPSASVPEFETDQPLIKLMPVIVTGQPAAVYRYFDQDTGAHVYTSDSNEFANLGSFIREASDFGSLTSASITTDPDATNVYRLFDTRSGSHFFTSSRIELNGLLDQTSSTYRPDLINEPSSTFIEHLSPAQDDIPVYRFFEQADGSHFYSSSQTEVADLQNPGSAFYRPDMVFEGVAFYAPQASA